MRLPSPTILYESTSKYLFRNASSSATRLRAVPAKLGFFARIHLCYCSEVASRIYIPLPYNSPLPQIVMPSLSPFAPSP